MTTRFAASLAAMVALLVPLGLALGNPPLMYTGLVPVIVLFIGMVLRPPRAVRVSREMPTHTMWVRDVMEVTWEVRLGYGPCAMLVFDQLPDEFALVEGNNIRLLHKGFRPATFRCSYKVRCTKRGTYAFSGTRWQVRDLLGLFQPEEGHLDGQQETSVRPRILRARRLRPLRAHASTLYPETDIARLGMPTNEFKEIRHYAIGDPLRAINWKATARTASYPGSVPLVNEYEPEGRKAIWLFVDASREMEVGTSIENALEWAVEAASGISYYFLQRGFRVGGCIYNTDTGEPEVFYSDTGKRQYFVLSKELTDLRPGSPTSNLLQAVERSKSHLIRHKPLSIVVTRLDVFPERPLIQGIRRLVQLSSRRGRRRPAIIVIGINGYLVAPRSGTYHSEAVTMTRVQTSVVVNWLHRMGAQVLEWDPLRESLGQALMRKADLP